MSLLPASDGGGPITPGGIPRSLGVGCLGTFTWYGDTLTRSEGGSRSDVGAGGGGVFGTVAHSEDWHCDNKGDCLHAYNNKWIHYHIYCTL